MRLSSVRAFTLLLPALLLAGCRGDDTPEFYDGEFAFTEIHLDPSIVRPGETTKAHLIAIGGNGEALGEVEAQWSGDHPAVATVDPDGTIHAISVGQVTLSTTADPVPHNWGLYVTPTEACGMASSVWSWRVEGGFTWEDTASSVDSAIATHHSARWSINAREGRQINTSEIAWRATAPRGNESFSLTTNDTLHVGASAWIHRVHTPGGEPISFLGLVILDLQACELYTVMYPSKADSFFKLRPGLTDSLTYGYPADGWQPFGTARVDASAITNSTPIALGGDLPILPPTDTDVHDGYAPTGYAAFVSLWKPGRGPVTITMTARPGWVAD